ncbi:MAG TPA: type II toxin-antitoxin system PemK/MazF family toxin [Rectinemataceae bacterium]|nr:type II toxin-antitoxin system PemK/MazF family toxin [Rectinemataceae bacterium]
MDPAHPLGFRRARGRRGAVPWADLDPTIGSEKSGKRPVLVLSSSVFNKKSGTVIAVALTSQEPRAGFPLTLELMDTRLPKRSWAKISQIRTLAVERIGAKLGSVDEATMEQVLEGLNEILDD